MSATLLLCHAGGFCKQVWTPVVRRLRRSPLFTSVDIVSFDFPFHGANGRTSDAALASVDWTDPARPVVRHPAAEWATPVAAVESQAKRPKNRSPLVGIGHSMGATALWKVEVETPGTFDLLILFKPMVNAHDLPGVAKHFPRIAAKTISRSASWDSKDAAMRELTGLRTYSTWHPEALDAFIQGGVVRAKEGKYVLACDPLVEASLFCTGSMRMTKEEQARVRCPIVLVYGSESLCFSAERAQTLVDEFPGVYSLTRGVPNTSHLLVMEDPDVCTQRVIEAFEKTGVLGAASSHL